MSSHASKGYAAQSVTGLKIPASYPTQQLIQMDEFIVEYEKLVAGYKTISINYDKESKQIIFINDNAIETIHIKLDDKLQLVSKEVVVKDKRYIEAYDEKKRIVLLDKQKKELKITTYSASLKENTSYEDYEPGMLWQNSFELYLQAMLMNGVSSFKGKIFADSNQKTVSVNFNHIKSKNLQKISPKYKFPEKYNSCTNLKQDVNVFELEMTGMMSLFFSDKFYYAFKDSYPFELIAVWGGGLEDAFFNFNQAYFSQFCKI
jgi:hypothetical protein